MNNHPIDDECCPEFNPMLWDAKVFTWDRKLFIKDKVRTIFYIPLNFGIVMKRIMDKIEKAGAKVPDWLCLSYHTSMWNMDIYTAVDKNIEDAEHAELSGNFYSKVYEGSFNETGKWSKDFTNSAISKGLEVKKIYMWYTTCPKCAKKYGKNYVVLTGLIE